MTAKRVSSGLKAQEKMAPQVHLARARATVDLVLANLKPPNAAELVSDTKVEGWLKVFNGLEADLAAIRDALR